MAGLKKRDGIRQRTDPPRGILSMRPEEVEGVVRYWSSPDLDPFVEHYWIARWDLLEPEVAEVVPQPSVQMVIQAGASEVFGLSRERLSRRLVGRGRMLGTKFRPGAFRPFLRHAVSTLAGKRLPLTAAFGPRAHALEVRALRHENDHAAIAVVEDFLRSIQPCADANMILAGHIVARIAGDRSLTRVDQIAAQFDVSARALQRLFREYVGASPKRVILCHRLFEAADRVASEGDLDWADIALDLGFADQAHLIREFKKLVGRSPAEYARTLDRRRGPGC